MLVNEDVVRLEIAVCDAFVVHLPQGLAELLRVLDHGRSWKTLGVLSEDLSEGLWVVLHDDAEVVILLANPVDLGHTLAVLRGLDQFHDFVCKLPLVSHRNQLDSNVDRTTPPLLQGALHDHATPSSSQFLS